MAFLIAKQFSFFIVLISLLSSHAREFQRFSQTPAVTTALVPNDNKTPEFVTDDGNSYGLYGQASNPPTTTTTTTVVTPTTPSTLPRNYNPVSYVTGEEANHIPPPPPTPTFDFEQEKEETLERSSSNNGFQYPNSPWQNKFGEKNNDKYFQTEQEEEETFDPTTSLAAEDKGKQSFTGKTFPSNYDTFRDKEYDRNDVKTTDNSNSPRQNKFGYFGMNTNYNDESYQEEEEEEETFDPTTSLAAEDKGKQSFTDKTFPSNYDTSSDKEYDRTENDNNNSLQKQNKFGKYKNYNGESYQPEQEEEEEETFDQVGNHRVNNNNNYQTYGMSDTRKLKGGKYYYDVQTNAFPHPNHPYNRLNSYRNNDKINGYKSYQYQANEDTNTP